MKTEKKNYCCCNRGSKQILKILKCNVELKWMKEHTLTHTKHTKINVVKRGYKLKGQDWMEK